MHTEVVLTVLENLQNQICTALEQENGGAVFACEKQTGKLGVGETRVLKSGTVFEQAGMNFSYVEGSKMPASATAHCPELAGAAFEAVGVPLVIHPKNPYVSTSHANVRLFIAYPEGGESVWWFGGGFDLTPFYPFEEDILHWHTVARDVCAPFREGVYSELKKWCDEYFYLKHHGETRGVDDLFFDDLNRWDFDTCLSFIKVVGEGYIEAYLPIAAKRKDTPYGERGRDFQLYWRGRYAGFNLVWDRGTLFGLQSGGRTKSVLMPMPPLVRFEHQYVPEEGSPEARPNEFLAARDWLGELSRESDFEAV